MWQGKGGYAPNGWNVWINRTENNFATAEKRNSSPIASGTRMYDAGNLGVDVDGNPFHPIYAWVTAILADGTETEPSPVGSGALFKAANIGINAQGPYFVASFELNGGHVGDIWASTQADFNSADIVYTTEADATSATMLVDFASPGTPIYFWLVDRTPDGEVFSQPSDSTTNTLIGAAPNIYAEGYDNNVVIYWDDATGWFLYDLYRDGVVYGFSLDNAYLIDIPLADWNAGTAWYVVAKGSDFNNYGPPSSALNPAATDRVPSMVTPPVAVWTGANLTVGVVDGGSVGAYIWNPTGYHTVWVDASTRANITGAGFDTITCTPDAGQSGNALCIVTPFNGAGNGPDNDSNTVGFST
jgi:hypothetical protein